MLHLFIFYIDFVVVIVHVIDVVDDVVVVIVTATDLPKIRVRSPENPLSLL